MSAAHADRIETVEMPFMPFGRARAHAARVEGILTSDEMIRKPHSELEAMLDGQGKEWARLLLEENLRLRAQLERKTAVVGADGAPRESARDSLFRLIAGSWKARIFSHTIKSRTRSALAFGDLSIDRSSRPCG